MNEYDTALKLLLQACTGSALRQVTGGIAVARWLNPEFPQVQARRADLLGATVGGQLVHIELQSTNDADMPLRMLEYAVGTYRQFGELPIQIVLYVGEAPLRMTQTLHGPVLATPDLAFRFTLVDFRDLDGNALLKSTHVEANVLAILTRLQDRFQSVRQVLQRIAVLEEPARRAIPAHFLIISGLRSLGQAIQEEARKMPILNDILSHDLLGPAILQGRQEGRQELLRRLLEKRFGPIPNWVEARLASLSASEIDEVAVRVLETPHLEELFPDK